MNVRKLCIIGCLAAGALAAGWFAWRWSTTPSPPVIQLDDVDQTTAEAVRKALAAVRRQPRSGETWGQLAMLMAANGFYEHLPFCYAQAEHWEPLNPAWPYLHGVHLLEVNPNLALPLLEKTLTLTTDPTEQAAVHFRLAQALIEHGQLLDAERHVDSLRRLEPAGPRLQFVAGLLALARAERDTARQLLSRLTDVPYVRSRACTLLAGLVPKDQAREYQERATRLPPDHAWPDPFEERMIGYKVDRTSRFADYIDLDKQGRQQEALSLLRGLARESPDAETCFMLGYALYTRRAYEEAENSLRDALRYDPKNVKTHLLIGSCLLQRGENLLQHAPGDPAARPLLGQALQAFDATLALQKEHGFAHLYRGWTLKNLGRTDEALQALRNALLIHPNLTDVHLYLGETLAETGHFPEALAHLENAVQFAGPNDERARTALEKWRKKSKAPTGKK